MKATRFSIGAATLIVAGIAWFGSIADNTHAASTDVYLNPANQTVTVNSTFTLTIYADVGGASTQQVLIDLAYNSSFLSCISTGGTADFPASSSSFGCSSGSVSINRFSTTAAQGNLAVATVTFKTLKTGTTSVTFNPSYTYVYTNDGFATTVSPGGTYVIQAYSPPQPVVSSSGSTKSINHTIAPTTSKSSVPATSSKPAASSNPIAAPSQTEASKPPTISNLSTAKDRGNNVTISWTTDQPADSRVDYGIDTHYGRSIASSNLTTKHAVTLNASGLLRGYTYYFEISSANQYHLTDNRYNSFKTDGFTVKLHILDRYNQVLSNADITIENTSAYTNRNGDVTFTDIPHGVQPVQIAYHGHKYSDAVNLDSSGKIQPIDSFTLTDKNVQAQVGTSWRILASILGTILFFVCMISLLIYRLMHRTSKSLQDSDLSYLIAPLGPAAGIQDDSPNRQHRPHP